MEPITPASQRSWFEADRENCTVINYIEDAILEARIRHNDVRHVSTCRCVNFQVAANVAKSDVQQTVQDTLQGVLTTPCKKGACSPQLYTKGGYLPQLYSNHCC